MQTPVPPAVGGALAIYQAQDGSIWAVNTASGFGTPLTGQPSAPTAPPPSGGGGGAADPNAVQKSGDTMTGTLLFSGDQFDVTLGAAVPAIALQSSAGGPSGFELDSFGDVALTGSRKHLMIRNGAIDLMTPDDSRITIGTDYGSYGIQWASSGGKGVTITLDLATGDLTVQGNSSGFGIRFVDAAGGTTTRLRIDPGGGGDIIATAVAGPNAGKSVNLTYGKWA